MHTKMNAVYWDNNALRTYLARVVVFCLVDFPEAASPDLSEDLPAILEENAARQERSVRVAGAHGSRRGRGCGGTKERASIYCDL